MEQCFLFQRATCSLLSEAPQPWGAEAASWIWGLSAAGIWVITIPNSLMLASYSSPQEWLPAASRQPRTSWVVSDHVGGCWWGSSCWCEDQLRGVSPHPALPCCWLQLSSCAQMCGLSLRECCLPPEGRKKTVTIWSSLFLNMSLKIKILDSEIRHDLNSSFATLNIISLNICFLKIPIMRETYFHSLCHRSIQGVN